MIRYIASALLIGLFLAASASGQVRTYRHLAGGKPLHQHIESGVSKGIYVILYDPLEKDTLTVWFEHVDYNGTPNRRAARYADAVVWCHPSRHPHPKHVLPNAKGEIMAYQKAGAIHITTRRWSKSHNLPLY